PISIGQFSFGLLSVGQFAIGVISIGQIAFGLYSIGLTAIGKYVYSNIRKDHEVIELFSSMVKFLKLLVKF
ncbi:MAG: hypothetical protein ABIM64_04825, partial [candidate division WOR-3 bacterium]